MSKLSNRAQAMKDAMEIACLVEAAYGESTDPIFIRLREERRLPYDTPSFQGAYAALCLERGLSNQYLIISQEDLNDHDD